MLGGGEFLLLFIIVCLLVALPIITYKLGYRKGSKDQAVKSELEFLKKHH